MWYPSPSHSQKLEGRALPHHSLHGGTSSTLPVAGSRGSQEGPQGAGCKKFLCTHSSLGLVMVGVAQGNKNWLNSEEEESKAGPSVRSEAKTQGNSQGPHGDSLGVENYSCLGEAVPIFGLPCLQNSFVQTGQTFHTNWISKPQSMFGFVLSAGWMHTSKRCIFLNSVPGTAAGPVQNVLNFMSSLEQRQSYQSNSYPKQL